jgi:hypothetical protein
MARNAVFRNAWNRVARSYSSTDTEHQYLIVRNLIYWFPILDIQLKSSLRIWCKHHSVTYVDYTAECAIEAGRRSYNAEVAAGTWTPKRQLKTRKQRERRQALRLEKAGRLQAGRRENTAEGNEINTSVINNEKSQSREAFQPGSIYMASPVVPPGARTAKVLELKEQGRSYREIADELGIKKQTVATLVQRHKKQQEKKAAEQNDWLHFPEALEAATEPEPAPKTWNKTYISDPTVNKYSDAQGFWHYKDPNTGFKTRLSGRSKETK